MNHTRFPKEDHLPDQARRDNKAKKGDPVDKVQTFPAQTAGSISTRNQFAYYPEDGNSRFLRNVGMHISNYTASRPTASSSRILSYDMPTASSNQGLQIARSSFSSCILQYLYFS